MIPIKADREKPTVVGTTMGATEFKMKTSGKAFKLFSASLYSNKIAAILRELSTNAVDAQKEIGREHVPIKVVLPTELRPTLTISDSGVGMSYDVLTTIYSTVFESTKNTSNDYNGEMGLGSKSPIFYADSMTVTSVHKGQKTVAAVYLNENSIPCIDVINVSETSEQSGTSISLSVDTSDIHLFQKEAVNIYSYFDVLPDIEQMYDNTKEELTFNHTRNKLQRESGIKLDDGTVVVLSETERYSPTSDAKIVQSGVCYPVSDCKLGSKTFRQLENSAYGFLVRSKQAVFYVPNGKVAFGPSREEVEYNKHNKKYFEYLVSQCISKFEGYVRDLFEGVKSKEDLVEIFIQYNSQFSVYSKDLSNVWVDHYFNQKMFTEIVTDLKNKYSLVKDINGSVTQYASWRSKGSNSHIFVAPRDFDAMDKMMVLSIYTKFIREGYRAFLPNIQNSSIVYMDKRYNKKNTGNTLTQHTKKNSVYLISTENKELYKQLADICDKEGGDWVTTVTDLVKKHNIPESSLKTNSSGVTRTAQESIEYVTKRIPANSGNKVLFAVLHIAKGKYLIADIEGRVEHEDVLTVYEGYAFNDFRDVLCEYNDVDVVVVSGITRWKHFVKSQEFKDMKADGKLADIKSIVSDIEKEAIQEIKNVDVNAIAKHQLMDSLPYAISSNVSKSRVNGRLGNYHWLTKFIPTLYYREAYELKAELDKKVETVYNAYSQRCSHLQHSFDANKWITSIISKEFNSLIEGVSQ